MIDSKSVMPVFGGIAASVLVSAGLKASLLWADVVPFNSDEAVVALMARHILHGARPVFFYGQAYMGSLDAWLVALAFKLLGEQVWVIRAVQALLYSLTLVTTVWLGTKLFNRAAGLLAGIFMAIPAVNVTLYTTVSLGGYGEALLIGNLILLAAISCDGELDKGSTRFGALLTLWGFLTGLGLWAFGLTLVYSLPAGIYIAWGWLGRASKGGLHSGGRPSLLFALLAIAGFIAGSSPWWGFALSHGFQRLLSELAGGAIAGVEELSYLQQIGQHSASLILLGSSVVLGLRPPWGIQWLGLPLLPFVLLSWMAIFIAALRAIRQPGPRRSQRVLLAGVGVTLCAGFILTPFGADPSGRYFLPLAVPLAVFAGGVLAELAEKHTRWLYWVAALLVVYPLWGTVQSALAYPPGITTQFNPDAQIDTRKFADLAEFLQSQGERYGYTNYWVSYPLAFYSREELVFVPRLPYHADFRYTERDDRYLDYDRQVAQAGRVAYITTHHPLLDEYLQKEFRGLGVRWRENTIGDFHVFYALSKPVRPEEIGLGRTAP